MWFVTKCFTKKETRKNKKHKLINYFGAASKSFHWDENKTPFNKDYDDADQKSKKLEYNKQQNKQTRQQSHAFSF